MKLNYIKKEIYRYNTLKLEKNIYISSYIIYYSWNYTHRKTFIRKIHLKKSTNNFEKIPWKFIEHFYYFHCFHIYDIYIRIFINLWNYFRSFLFIIDIGIFSIWIYFITRLWAMTLFTNPYVINNIEIRVINMYIEKNRLKSFWKVFERYLSNQ